MKRYQELNSPFDINAIFRGHDVTGVKQNKIYEEFYQLGWNSMVSFKKDGNEFTNLNIRSFKTETKPDMLPASNQRFSQIVTRGVQTCTAVAIMRGDSICLMHLDLSELTNQSSAIINEVWSYLNAASGETFIISSTIDDHDEISFVRQLKDAGSGQIYHNSINRGPLAPSSFFGHLEFGVAFQENSPVVYGDKTTVDFIREFIIHFTATQEQVDEILFDPPVQKEVNEKPPARKCIIV